RGVEFSGVFDIVPNAVNHRPQFIANPLIVMHGVVLAAPFDPPVGAAVVSAANDPALRNRRFRNILGEARRRVFHGMTDVFRIKKQRAAERDIIRHLRRPLFAELLLRFPADSMLRSGEKTYKAVSGAIEEKLAFESDTTLRSHHPTGYRLDA